MSEGESTGTGIGNAIAMMVIIAALVLAFIAIAILTFLASPGMLIVGTAKLIFGLSHSARQVWVLSVAVSAAILIALVIVRRNAAQGVAAHLLLCAVTMILWSLLAYGFEAKPAEALAAVFFPGFTINEAPTMAGAVTAGDRPAERTDMTGEGRPAPVVEVASAETPAQATARPTMASVPEDGQISAPTPVPMASFRVAFRLPLKRAYVTVRLNDREVFRCDFRSKDQPGTPGLVTPPIKAAAGPVIVKVWVISPDKKEADEYVVLPVDLGAGEERRLGLVFDPMMELKGRLVAERG